MTAFLDAIGYDTGDAGTLSSGGRRFAFGTRGFVAPYGGLNDERGTPADVTAIRAGRSVRADTDFLLSRSHGATGATVCCRAGSGPRVRDWRMRVRPCGLILRKGTRGELPAGFARTSTLYSVRPTVRSQCDAKVAFANAFQDARLRMKRESLPHAVFTDPEVGSVGLTEHAARDRATTSSRDSFRSSASRRPSSIGETRGFIKYVAERDTHRLLGCHVVGYQGADLVYDAVVVTRAEGLIDDLALAVGIFPTLQEGMEGVARAVLRKAAP